MPLTAAEWLSENSERQELALQNIPLAMELYARYKADIECVEFADMIGVRNYDYYENRRWHADMQTDTTTELHTIYKQSKTN